MKKHFRILTIFLFTCSIAFSQEKDTIVPSKWNHNIAIGFYFIKDNFIFMPVYRIDKKWLHLEARYNYEDKHSLSAWFGYNFTGGNKFQYTITPMLGGIVGNTYGIAPGVELDLSFFGFEFYSESEIVFDLQSKSDFFYNWTDFTYSPLDWLWFGLSCQRTRIYQTDLYFQPGFELGGGYRWFEVTGYIFNLGFDDPYPVITVSVRIPE